MNEIEGIPYWIREIEGRSKGAKMQGRVKSNLRDARRSEHHDRMLPVQHAVVRKMGG
jgi:hypothetical protein